MKTNEYTMFKLSKPWGYHPPEVEQTINNYEKTLRELNIKYLEEKQISLNLQGKVERLQSELREMHLQMSSLELPDTEEAIEHLILDDFKNYNSNNKDNSYEEPKSFKLNKYNESENDIVNGDLPFNIVK